METPKSKTIDTGLDYSRDRIDLASFEESAASLPASATADWARNSIEDNPVTQDQVEPLGNKLKRNRDSGDSQVQVMRKELIQMRRELAKTQASLTKKDDEWTERLQLERSSLEK